LAHASAAQALQMLSLPTALARAFAQLTDPAILRVLAKSMLLTLAVLGLLGFGAWHLLAGVLDRWDIPYGGELGALVAVVLTAIGGWLLFRLVALAVLQFFADEVVQAVEARHYPAALASARSIGWKEELRNSMRSTLRAVIANLVAAPFAIALLVTGVGTPILFLLVNGWLLGRELQDMVWLRHAARDDSVQPLGAPLRFVLGASVAGLLIIPFVNLLAPVIGAAAATHLVHGRKGTRHAN